MIQSAKVSIIIPTHNGMNCLERAVSSAFSQDYGNLEIIVVDDNGKGTYAQQETEKVIEKYLKDPRFKYIVHEKNKNGSAARNTGAKNASGKYLNFLDDDDELGPKKISFQVEQMESLSDEWAGSYSSAIIQYNGKEVRKILAKKSGNLLIEHLTSAIRISTPSLLLRKAVWEKIGGHDETFLRHQDWEFNARILDKYKLINAENVYYKRNYTFRHSAENIFKAERNLVHFTEVMRTKLKSIPKEQLEDILRRKYITILLGYLKKGNLKEFLRVWNDQGFKTSDIYHIISYIFLYFKSRIQYGKAF